MHSKQLLTELELFDDSNMIVYNSPSFDLGGVTASFDLEYSPKVLMVQESNDGGSATVKMKTWDQLLVRV